jgi:hypothetical protein
VETPTKRIGRVAGIRYGERSNEPEVLEVRGATAMWSVAVVGTGGSEFVDRAIAPEGSREIRSASARQRSESRVAPMTRNNPWRRLGRNSWRVLGAFSRTSRSILAGLKALVARLEFLAEALKQLENLKQPPAPVGVTVCTIGDALSRSTRI